MKVSYYYNPTCSFFCYCQLVLGPTPSTELSSPISCDPKELDFCDIYTSDEKWKGKKKVVGGGLERYKKHSYNKGA